MAQAHDLKRLRAAKDWTQAHAAERLGVSQPYWSLLEKGARRVPKKLGERLTKLLRDPAWAPLPVLDTWGPVDADKLAERLATLGYPGFAYLRTRRTADNPAAVLLWALTEANLEPRLVEALPWILLQYPTLPLEWIAREARLRNLQNRLGFVAHLAAEVHSKGAQKEKVEHPALSLQGLLEPSRLARVDTLCEASMSLAARRSAETARSPAARHWNLLTEWKAEHLPYAA